MGLAFRDISKRYGAVVAIKQAQMEIEEGEVRAILGGNGSGKSTLAKIIGGLISRDGGEILFQGQRVDFKSPKDAKRNHVIMTSQELSLFGNLTVEENICISNIPVKGKFTDRKRLRKKAQDVLERMRLDSLMGKKVEELAANQQYMVELAKALVQEPKILIIDEITSALYREDVEIVDDIIRGLKKEGCIVLFISHRMVELYAMCDSVTIMRNGETLGTYPMKEKTEDELLSLMVGTKIESYHGEGRHHQCAERDVFIRAPRIPIPTYGTLESLDIGKGEIIGVAGLQGHGQTDLIRALYGVLGEIELEIDGKVRKIRNAKQAVSEGFAFISGDREKDGTFQERSLSENIAAVQELVKRGKIGNPRGILDSFHVHYDNPGELITSLSGGNQQKVVVGRWLCTRPRLLLADDPTKGIDVKARTDLHQLFAELAREGNAVIMLSSDDDELVSITSMVETSRVIVMYEGRVSAILEGDAINRQNISAASMPVNSIHDAEVKNRKEGVTV
ncbi:ribose transport system ATP-binding protein [Muricomes intestini]|uniref:Ribose transport system ATP-binding protein n=1 Tax=Muricomes intestini TaxID=1796634 RepID=A0A4R3K4N2_9FIRM|nr:sugar ABC transporter ATP-binding protein [Muricomes intestini]TCS77748.1 ribose transport system ATP-binding protein [Muricomes intestini]